MIAWRRSGFAEAEFWESTPRLVELAFDAASQLQDREHNDRAWLAWHIAVLTRTKKLQKLDDLLVKVGGGKRAPQTESQMLSIAKMMAGVTFPETRR